MSNILCHDTDHLYCKLAYLTAELLSFLKPSRRTLKLILFRIWPGLRIPSMLVTLQVFGDVGNVVLHVGTFKS